MRKNRFLQLSSLCLLAVGIAFAAGWRSAPLAGQTLASANTAAPVPARPPAAPVRAVTDDYFGIKVADPYRYMENLKDPEVQSWLKSQDDFTRATLARIPGRAQLLADIVKYDTAAPAKVSRVFRLPGSRFFYLKTLAKDNFAKLYLREGLSGPEKLLVDPGRFVQPGGAPYAINYFSPSGDGRYAAYGVSPGGSEDAVMRVLDTTTGNDTGEVIDRAQFGDGLTWLPDNRSFVFTRLQKIPPGGSEMGRYLNSRVYLHAVGDDPEKDVEVFGIGSSSRVEITPTDIPIVATTPGSSYALGLIFHGVLREWTIYAAPVATLGKPETPWQKICDVADGVTNATVYGDDIYLLSHKDAPRFQVLRTSLVKPDVAHAEVVVPQREAVLTDLGAAADAVYVTELDGGVGRLLRVPFGHGLTVDRRIHPGRPPGSPEQIKLPFDGSVNVYSPDTRVSGVVFEMTSWVKAPRIYAYNPGPNDVTDTKLRPAGEYDNPEDLTSIEVKAKSYDGTMVPLSIVYKRGTPLDGSNPALLQGYGSYGITSDPYFDPKRLAFLERGGVYAVAHVRGGGEYGEDWHRWGQKLTKANTWRDMIACGEYLVENKYTSPAKLGIFGGSAGGITVGRSLTERPDLFAAVIDAVGDSDSLRIENTPNGPPNIPEFGSTKTQEGFEDLYAMSSYVHVRDGAAYPAVLLTTGINDPRVASWQAGKMTARLQSATSSGKPILLRVDYEAGHGIGSTKKQQEETLADEYSFLLWQVGAADFQPQ